MNGTMGTIMKTAQTSFFEPGEVVPAEEVDPREHDCERVDEADEDFEEFLHGLRIPRARQP